MAAPAAYAKLRPSRLARRLARETPNCKSTTMHEDWLLVVTAIGEAVVGLALVIAPSIFIRLLVGVSQASPELSVACRIAGTASVAIAVSC